MSKVYLVSNSLYAHLKVNIRTRIDDITSPSKSSFQRPFITSSQSLPSVTRPLPSLDSSESHSKRQSFTPLTSKKRSFTETIDLTIDDEDSYKAEPSGRKKSRSSSIEAGIKQSGVKSGNSLSLCHSNFTALTLHIISNPSYKDVYFKAVFESKDDRLIALIDSKSIRSKTVEKSPLSDLSNPKSSLHNSNPAIIVPSLQLSPKERRDLFTRNLSVLQNVSVVNAIDDTSPPLDFQFVIENIFRDGVEQASDDFMSGCGCRKDNGRNMGCEYLYCTCLDDLVNSEGKKQFPYSQAKVNTACLRDAFIKGRNHIYECNKKCNCGNNCKNRVVQHGRTVGLQIFKTINRGWGTFEKCHICYKLLLHTNLLIRTTLYTGFEERPVH